ncbi:uncharacterized vacuolar membrane protein YML018C-like isoform X1 [Malania oleifera]|uniref:uncharacterized vacuolar membrane protein YML018C-like isoform X1 n=1 Tax=Malania oleifera TaxID=397392 RepID=UPI0025AE692C|nr:uncharacterized vacuolar membrane protein YML018C-like isoform X1 [Malania oleifera]
MGWRYRAGLLLIITIVILWVTSAEVTQGVFKEYNQPFAVTYFGTSLLVVYLPIAFIKDWLCNTMRNRSRTDTSSTDEEAMDGSDPVKCESAQNFLEIELEGLLPVTDRDVEEGKALVVGCEDDGNLAEQGRKLNPREVVTLGLCLAPVWFITEYLAHASLARTSVASTTMLFSTSGFFTLFIGALLGEDTISIAKVVCVFVSMAGVAMTTFGSSWTADESQNGKHSLLGNIFGLASAVIDGLFFVLLKKFAGEDGERVDLQKLFGFIGLFTLVALWSLAWPLTALGIESNFFLPRSFKTAEIVLANSFVGTVLSDYLWALGVVWTNPLVSALGESLTIPLAMASDMVIHGRHYSVVYILGSALVFLGFVGANFSEWISEKLKLCNLNSLLKFFNIWVEYS